LILQDILIDLREQINIKRINNTIGVGI
jgi:hypothetical protein